MARGKRAEALEAYRKALAIRQKLVDDSPTVTEFQRELARRYFNLGYQQRNTANHAEVMDLYDKALAIQQKLADANRTELELRAELAQIHSLIGDALLTTGKPAEALLAYRQGLAIRQKLVDDHRADTSFQEDLAWSHHTIGIALVSTGKPAEALEAFRKALVIRQKLVNDNPTNAWFQDGLAGCHDVMGWLLVHTRKPAEALKSFREALPIRQKLGGGNPAGFNEHQERLANLHILMGVALGRQKQFTEAFTALDAGLAIDQRFLAQPDNTLFRAAPGWCHASRGTIWARAEKPGEAAADLRRALELWAKIPHPDNETQFGQSRALALLARLGTDAKSGVTKEEAKAFADQSVAALAAVGKTGWALPSELKEPDFDALRGRADFKTLVREVEAKSEKPAANDAESEKK